MEKSVPETPLVSVGSFGDCIIMGYVLSQVRDISGHRPGAWALAVSSAQQMR